MNVLQARPLGTNAIKADYAGGTKYVERLYLSNLDLKTAYR